MDGSLQNFYIILEYLKSFGGKYIDEGAIERFHDTHGAEGPFLSYFGGANEEYGVITIDGLYYCESQLDKDVKYYFSVAQKPNKSQFIIRLFEVVQKPESAAFVRVWSEGWGVWAKSDIVMFFARSRKGADRYQSISFLSCEVLENSEASNNILLFLYDGVNVVHLSKGTKIDRVDSIDNEDYLLDSIVVLKNL